MNNNRKPSKKKYEYERGFNLYFSGANKTLADETNKKLREMRSRPHNKSKPSRRGWSKKTKKNSENDMEDSPYKRKYDEEPIRVERKSNKWKERQKRRSSKKVQGFGQEVDKVASGEDGRLSNEKRMLNKQYTINLEERRNDLKMRKKNKKRVQTFKETMELQKSILGLHLEDKQKLRESIANLKFKDIDEIRSERKRDERQREEVRPKRPVRVELEETENSDLKGIWDAIYSKRHDNGFLKQIQKLIHKSQKSSVLGDSETGSRIHETPRMRKSSNRDMEEDGGPLPEMSLDIKSSDFGNSIQDKARQSHGLERSGRSGVGNSRKSSFRVSRDVKQSFKKDKIDLKASKQSDNRSSRGGFKLRLKPEDNLSVQSSRKSILSRKSRKPKMEQKFDSTLLSPTKDTEPQAEDDNLNLNFDLGNFDEDKLKIDNEDEFKPEPIKEKISPTKKSGIDDILDDFKIEEDSQLKSQLFQNEIEKSLTGSKISLRKSKGVLDDILTASVDNEDFDLDDIIEDQNAVLRVKGAHDFGREVGITELKFYDKKGKEIELSEGNVSIRGVRGVTLKNLFNNNMFTLDKKEMILLDFPILADFIDINIRFKGPLPVLLRIWNYNEDPGKGFKECDIILNGMKIETVELKKAKGVVSEHYHHDILLKDAIDPNQFPLPKPKKEAQVDFGASIGSRKNKIVVKPPSRRGNRRIISGVKRAKGNGSDLRKISDSLLSDKHSDIDKNYSTFKDLFNDQEGKSEARLSSKMSGRKSGSRRASNVKIGFKRRQAPEHLKTEKSPELDLSGSPRKSNLRIPKPGNAGKTSISKEFDSLLKNQRIDIEESIILDNKTDKKAPLVIEEPLFNNPKQSITPLERFNKHQSKFNFNDDGDILDMEFNNTLKNLQKFNKMNLSRMGTSNLDDIFNQQLQNKTSLEVNKERTDMGFEELLQASNNFRVPKMPGGSKLQINIYSTWGDKFYVGLSGIEVFDRRGKPINIDKEAVKAKPKDLNILPNFEGDPRTPDKLVDGVYRTCDEIHSWLAPFYEGSTNKIFLDFGREKQISMIRIWNYNKNRIHNSRGAKKISIFLDGNMIFIGEIEQATGLLRGAEDHCEYIAFCDENVFPLIEKFDWINKGFEDDKDFLMKSVIERPNTSNKNQFRLPSDASDINNIAEIRDIVQGNAKILEELEQKKPRKNQSRVNPTSTSFIECSKMGFKILETWGDEHYVGLTGIKFFDQDNKEILLGNNAVNANPRDLRAEGNHFDKRVLENILTDQNLTTNDANMWLVSFSKSHGQPSLFFNFGKRVKLSGMRIWNYNKSEVDSTRGAKRLRIMADVTQISDSEGVFLRKAPGRANLDYSQFIKFPIDQQKNIPKKIVNPISFDQFTYPPHLPTGFNLRVHMISTWGDSHYIGLNGLEVFDKKGSPCISRASITADPLDLKVCGNMGDIRKIENLKNGVNSSSEDKNIWLAPYINPKIKGESNYGREMNKIFIDFGNSVCVSCIKFWNYTKGDKRGVKEVQIFMDDVQIFSGEVNLSQGGSNVTSIIFTGNKMVAQKIAAAPHFKVEGQPIAYSNEGNHFGHDKRTTYEYENLQRPGTGFKKY